MVLNAIGVAVQCASYLPLFAVLAQSDSVGLTGPQLDGLAMLAVTTHQTGFVMAQVFFSAWLFPLGWLVLRFWESDIRKDLEKCVAQVCEYCGKA